MNPPTIYIVPVHPQDFKNGPSFLYRVGGWLGGFGEGLKRSVPCTTLIHVFKDGPSGYPRNQTFAVNDPYNAIWKLNLIDITIKLLKV